MPPSRLAIDANGALERQIGPNGLREADLEALRPQAERAHDELERRRRAGTLDFWTVPGDEGIQGPAAALGRELAERFENVVVLGIGGSSLGAKAVVAALGGPFRNLLPRERRRGARVFFPDNSDPATFAALLDCLDLASTCFVAITKSGSTAETLSQVLIVRERLGAARLPEQIIAVTDPEAGALRKIAAQEGWRTLPVPPGLGGRFSVLSSVGLLPIAAAGLDIEALCRGACDMRARCEAPSLRENPAYFLAGILHAFERRGRNIQVLFPYADALREMGAWFVQLVAESLGKSEGVGPTPVSAVGATDQHSMLQLLMEGPQNKVVTFVAVDEPVADLAIPVAWQEHDALAYLCGKSLGQLLDAERRGTAGALAEAGRPSLTLHLPRVDARAVGELIFLWEAAVAFAGFLHGIDPFDQPGVEASKKITQSLLGRPGTEAYATRLAARPAPDPAFVLG